MYIRKLRINSSDKYNDALVRYYDNIGIVTERNRIILGDTNLLYMRYNRLNGIAFRDLFASHGDQNATTICNLFINNKLANMFYNRNNEYIYVNIYNNLIIQYAFIKRDTGEYILSRISFMYHRDDKFHTIYVLLYNENTTISAIRYIINGDSYEITITQ
jgi:hypothetical protein